MPSSSLQVWFQPSPPYNCCLISRGEVHASSPFASLQTFALGEESTRTVSPDRVAAAGCPATEPLPGLLQRGPQFGKEQRIPDASLGL